jgi:hypothetical protein
MAGPPVRAPCANLEILEGSWTMNPFKKSLGAAVPSPLKNYTNEKLAIHALEVASPTLMANGETTLVKETVFSVAAAIKSAFEEKMVENLIGAYFDLSNETGGHKQAWEEGVDEVADEFALIAGKAAIDAIEDSPILGMGEATIRQFLDQIFETVKSDVAALKNDHGKPRSSL